MKPMISYAHKDSPNDTRFAQYADDPIPDWAVNIQPTRMLTFRQLFDTLIDSRVVVTGHQGPDYTTYVVDKEDFIVSLRDGDKYHPVTGFTINADTVSLVTDNLADRYTFGLDCLVPESWFTRDTLTGLNVREIVKTTRFFDIFSY